MTRQLSDGSSISCTLAHSPDDRCDICGTPKPRPKLLSDVSLAINLLSKSRWYQDGHMDAESLMNVLTKLLHKET